MFRSTVVLAFLIALTSLTSAQPRGAGRAGEQPQGSVAGVVIDAADGTPLRGATVALHKVSDSTLVTGDIVDADGRFSITGVQAGRYYARVSYVGYTVRFVEVAMRPGSLDVDLGRITIGIDSARSNSITVNARREFITMEIDRTTYRTEDLLVSSGGTATDVLRNIPSIEVDIDGNVSLRGNQNVVIQMNGRPVMLNGQSLAAFLQGLPAGIVERIEVIPNPSAKYDPEGMSGIINIVLKQESRVGFNGGVNGSISTQKSANIGLNLGYGDGPWNIFGSYGFNYGVRTASGSRFQENRLAEPNTFLESSSTDERRTPSHVFNGSVDYAFDRQNSLSFTGRLSRRDGNSEEVNTYNELDLLRAPTRIYERRSDEESEGFNMDYRLGYKWVGESNRHELSTELRYGDDRDKDAEAYLQQDRSLDGATAIGEADRQRTSQDEHNREITFQADYIRPLWEDARMEAGYKGEMELINNSFFSESFDRTSGDFLPDTRLNNDFSYERQIHAVYGNFSQEFGKFGLQVGVRAEQAMTSFDLLTTGEKFDKNYFSLFPSAFLLYKPSDALQLKGSYSRRINRPWTRTLNPFTSVDDPLFRRRGNPYLDPEYTDSYELSAVYFADGMSLTLTPFFRRTNDVIRHYQQIDSNGVTTTTFENFDVSDSWGADLIGSIRIGDWFNAFASLSAYRVVTDANNVEAGLGSDAIGLSARGNATVRFPWDLDLQVSYFYRAPMDVEGGRMGASSRGDIALQKKIFDNRGTIGLKLNDPFNASGFTSIRDDGNFYQESSRRWDARALSLTFSYTFGESSGTKRRQRGGGEQQGGGEEMEME